MPEVFDPEGEVFECFESESEYEAEDRIWISSMHLCENMFFSIRTCVCMRVYLHVLYFGWVNQ